MPKTTKTTAANSALFCIYLKVVTGLPTNIRLTRGQSIVGILIAIAVFSILAQSVFTLTSTSYGITSFNRARITAKQLAQEKMELIRNLPYDKVGTIGGVPSSDSIPQTETINRNGLTYTVKIGVIYVDDPFDGTQGGAPDDLLATDYKRARVEVSWEGLARSRKNPVVLVTDVAPKSIETTDGGGTLSIFVIDANGEPVTQAQLTIIATSITPEINITAQTAANGRYILPGMQPCDACYEITVDKTGYTSDQTYSTSVVANPNNPHQSVLEGKRTDAIFSIDKVSAIAITSTDTRDNNFVPLGNVSFRMRGETKIIGTDTFGDPVYKYDEVLTTDGSGNLTIDDLEWDTYTIYFADLDALDIAGSNPLVPIAIDPDTTNTFSFSSAPHSANSLLSTIVDTSGIQIASATATLNLSPSFEKSVVTGNSGDPDFGQAFFDNLSQTTYDLTATASGFLPSTASVVVDGRSQETVILEPE